MKKKIFSVFAMGVVCLGGTAAWAADESCVYTPPGDPTKVPPPSTCVISGSQAVGPARTDEGKGLCGFAAHYKAKDSAGKSYFITSVAQATTLLNNPNDAQRDSDTSSKVYPTVNFAIEGDVNSKGQFSGSENTDISLPFDNGNNNLVRLRGYVNITKAGTYTFAAYCDDGCGLSLGSKHTPIFDIDSRIWPGLRRIVTFEKAGLYPIEWVYYQQKGSGIFEWSMSESSKATDETKDVISPVPTDTFHLVPTSALFNNDSQVSESCQECGDPNSAACPNSSACVNGLCQTCNTDAHCGASCQPCAADKVCNATTWACEDKPVVVNPTVPEESGCQATAGAGGSSWWIGGLVALAWLGLVAYGRMARARLRS